MAKKVKILNIKCKRISKKGASNCTGYDANGNLVVEANVILFTKVK